MIKKTKKSFQQQDDIVGNKKRRPLFGTYLGIMKTKMYCFRL